MNTTRETARQAANVRKRASRRAHDADPPALPRFVAVDGEGRNVAGVGSEHRYTLLAASTGEYYENVADGLSTGECLEFLTRLGHAQPGARFVAFALNYDVNMLLRDVPRRQLERLWTRGYTRVYLRDVDCWYGLSYVPSKWFGVTQLRMGEPTPDASGRLRRRYSVVKGSSCRIWDVWGFFQKRFVSVLQEWLADEPEAIAAIARMKDARGEFTADDADAVRAYCLQECTLLVRVMDKLATTLWGVGLYPRTWLGAGAIASAILTKYGVKPHVTWNEVPTAAREPSLWAYFGGRVEIFAQGILPGTIWDYDVRSAYPATIAQLPSLRGATWTHDVGPVRETGRVPAHGLVHVTWDTRGHADAWLAPFPQHFTGGKVGWEPVGAGWYHVAEWAAAKRIFGEYIHEIEWYGCEPDPAEPPPFAFVPELYTARAAYKAAGDPRHYPLKVGLNSLYGKLAQSMTRDTDRPPPWQNYFLAGAVTAGTRARMLTGLHRAGRHCAVMAATDGLFLFKPAFSEPGEFLPLRDELGGWEFSEIAGGMALVQPGVYWEPPGASRAPRVRTRGFGVKSASYADAAALFAPPFRMEHRYKEVRFIGLGYAVNTGDWTQWRRWVALERGMSRGLMPYRRAHDEGFLRENGWTRVDMGVLHEPATRRPYTARGVRMREPDDEQLQAIVASEQPEGAGA